MGRWILRNTTDKFGAVRRVKQERGFENIQKSTRHKIGIAARRPRIIRIRDDKTAAEADALD